MLLSRHVENVLFPEIQSSPIVLSISKDTANYAEQDSDTPPEYQTI